MRAAVLDDDPEDRRILQKYLDRFQREENTSVSVDLYSSGMELLEKYDGSYDIILMDIEMPGINGLDTAREIRKADEAVVIVFITNMAQYALQGYEVSALDFMVKPVTYYNFSQKIRRAVRFAQRRAEQWVVLNGKEGVVRLAVSEICYMEKTGNRVCFHTKRGLFYQRDSLKAVKKNLKLSAFAEPMSGFLVNLNYVESINGNTVEVGEERVPMSRRLKKKFTEDYLAFLEGEE